MKHERCIAVVLALGAACLDTQADSPSVQVRLAPVTQQQVSDILTVYGRVHPDPDAVLTVAMPHAGLITRVAARLGQRVKRGDTLIELSTSPAAHMQYQQARDAVDYSLGELSRMEQLLKEQLATKAQVGAARKALADARSSLQAIEAQGADRALQTLVAPTDGIVVTLNVGQGDRVQADTAALAIASGDRLIAVLGVEPEDLPALHPGTPVKIRSVFRSDEEIDSRLSVVHAMIDPQTGLVDALAPVSDGRVRRLIIGSYLVADLLLNQHTGVVVPRSAVLRDAQGSFVFTVVTGKAKRIAVETGVEHGDWIEITRGLEAAERVVDSGNYELADGMAVREAE
ncbi:MAG: efflux RND transporter periplasmic adaptor subunit [Chromatiaceae bacterium]|jgi:RND family efflux transporter MFP subunit|nr:efflux RND transporter periplasmic adaptor subunit [Chromatiaceae bacterium]